MNAPRPEKDSPLIETETVDEESIEPSRTLRQAWTLVLLAVIIIGLPAIPGSMAPQVAVPVSLTCIFLGPLALGIVDGYQFRLSWTFIAFAGVCFWISKALYYPDGAWFYVIPVVLLAWLGSAVGAHGNPAAAHKGALRGA